MVPVTINACCTSMAFPSAWHSLVLSLPSIAVTCVLKAVISTLCSIATVSSPPLYFSQFSQACGCLSVEVDSPVIWFSCLPPCCSATAFWLLRDILLSISALATPISYSVLMLIIWLNLITCFSAQISKRATAAHGKPRTKLLLWQLACDFIPVCFVKIPFLKLHNVKWYPSSMQDKIIPVEVSICLIFI